jgi:hypothetical protein
MVVAVAAVASFKRIAPFRNRVSAAALMLPIVSAMSALIVCILFSASS